MTIHVIKSSSTQNFPVMKSPSKSNSSIYLYFTRPPQLSTQHDITFIQTILTLANFTKMIFTPWILAHIKCYLSTLGHGCREITEVKPRMPTGEDAVVQFKNFDKQYKAPFVVYADFECLTKPVSKASKNSAKSYTDAYQNHEPCGFCVCIDRASVGIFVGKLGE
eukprot:COSAG05_NODE_56_length_23335_cov_15.221338_7_plen_165_part_00